MKSPEVIVWELVSWLVQVTDVLGDTVTIFGTKNSPLNGDDEPRAIKIDDLSFWAMES